MFDAFVEPDRTKHGDAGADQQHLDNVLGVMNTAGRGQVSFDAPVQYCDPPHRQAQGLRKGLISRWVSALARNRTGRLIALAVLCATGRADEFWHSSPSARQSPHQRSPAPLSR